MGLFGKGVDPKVAAEEVAKSFGRGDAAEDWKSRPAKGTALDARVYTVSRADTRDAAKE